MDSLISRGVGHDTLLSGAIEPQGITVLPGNKAVFFGFPRHEQRMSIERFDRARVCVGAC
jgi:hypothetical protein